MVFVLDGKHRLDALAMNFGEHSLHVAHAGTPGYVMVAFWIVDQILEMERDDAAFQFFQAFERVQARADPMAGVAQAPIRLLRP